MKKILNEKNYAEKRKMPKKRGIIEALFEAGVPSIAQMWGAEAEGEDRAVGRSN